MMYKVWIVFSMSILYCSSCFSVISAPQDIKSGQNFSRFIASESVSDQSFDKSTTGHFAVRYSSEAWGQYPETVIPDGFYDIPGEERLPNSGEELSVDDIYGVGDAIPAYETFGSDSGATEVEGQIEFLDEL